LDLIGDIVGEEMEMVKTAFTINLGEITLQYIDAWTLDGAVGSVVKTKALFLTEILT